MLSFTTFAVMKEIKIIRCHTIRDKKKNPYFLLTYQHSTEASLLQSHQPPHIYLELYKELQGKGQQR